MSLPDAVFFFLTKQKNLRRGNTFLSEGYINARYKYGRLSGKKTAMFVFLNGIYLYTGIPLSLTNN
jgi:hypothetical protein